jgi:hypothetical protein
MGRVRTAVRTLLTFCICAWSVSPAAAQAWSPRAGQGGVTFTAQTINHVGRLLDDGTRIPCCGTTNTTIDVDVDYGLSNRWSVSFGLPYVFARYRGDAPAGPAAFLPYSELDACHCLHSSFQDFHFALHYNVMRVARAFSVTTSVLAGMPTHAYPYAAEAAVGFRQKSVGFAVAAGERLDGLVPRLWAEEAYAYTVAERSLGIRHDRSNVLLLAGYDITRRFGAQVVVSAQRTHGGLHFPADVEPFPARYVDFHRLLQDDYLQAGGGVSLGLGEWQFSAVMVRALSGTNSHDVHVYSVTAGRSFRLR